MSRINRVPEGLQSLLGSQNFGDNPSELSAVTQPILDLDKFLGKTLIRRGFVGANVTAVGAESAITVPDSEIWEPLAMSVQGWNSAAAGARATFIGKFAFPDEGGTSGLVEIPVVYSEVPTILTAASTNVRYGKTCLLPRGILLGPGSQAKIQVADIDLNGGTSINMNLTLWYKLYGY